MVEDDSIASLRREYTYAGLRRADLDPDPIKQFNQWFQQAIAAGIREPNAMALATADKQGRPSVRIVLLKEVSPKGFTFFTNYESRKGYELSENPYASLLLFWSELERQVCIAGSVSKVTRAESKKYFDSRPKGSRLAAWVSSQSETIADRSVLEKKLAALQAAHPGDEVPLPPYWGGFRVVPVRIEFWQGRPNRLHDRFQYLKEPRGWKIDRLSP